MPKRDSLTEEMTEATEETAEETAEDAADKAAQKEDSGAQEYRSVYYASVGALAALLTCAIFILLSVWICPKNITVEAGDAPNYSYITENGYWSAVCRVVTEPSAVDTSRVGEQSVTLRFFGFIDIRSRVTVVDTVPPVLVLRDAVIADNVPFDVQMLIVSGSDATEIKYSAEGYGEEAGEYTVTVIAADGGGNSSLGETRLTVVDVADTPVFEGGDEGEISSAVSSIFGRELDPDISHITKCGEYTVTAEEGGVLYASAVSVVDTTPPAASVLSYDLPAGASLDPDQFVSEVRDFSEVNITLSELPDLYVAGEYMVTVTLTDAYGNSSEQVSTVRVHDINTEITADLLSENEELESLIFNDERSREQLALPADRVTEGMSVGEYTVDLIGRYSSIPVTLNTVDRTPPVLILKNVYASVGEEISPEELILLCTDATEVSYTFDDLPKGDSEGAFEVTVSAVDSCGNETVAQASVHYYHHRSMPVIHRLENITAIVGEYPPYFRYVYATDDRSSDINLYVNTDEVDFSSPGVYPITYIAVDEDGNRTEEKVLLTLEPRIFEMLEVKNIRQNPALPNGCEVVSLAIALAYEGYEADPGWLFDNYMPHSLYDFNADPWTTYIGNPRGYGLGCYAPCVVQTGNDYLTDMGSELFLEDISGLPLEAYESYIDRGTPVIMWGLLYMNGVDHVHREWEHDGEQMRWLSNSHCLVLVGYTNDTYIFCDPLCGVIEYSREAVQKSFLINSSQACAIVK